MLRLEPSSVVEGLSVMCEALGSIQIKEEEEEEKPGYLVPRFEKDS